MPAPLLLQSPSDLCPCGRRCERSKSLPRPQAPGVFPSVASGLYLPAQSQAADTLNSGFKSCWL